MERKFLLTRLSRGATGENGVMDDLHEISTHTPLARRDNFTDGKKLLRQISTHTPLARRDQMIADYNKWSENFYSHASREARLLL